MAIATSSLCSHWCIYPHETPENWKEWIMIIDSQNVPVRQGSNYPDLFKPKVAGRLKQRLGDAAGLKNFGVNQVTLQPGGQSALRHWHSKQDEFIYVLLGELTLITDAGEQVLTVGMAAGFPAGEANGFLDL